MAIKNLGNFKKTIGKYEMNIGNDIVIEFENGYSGDDLVKFAEVLQKGKVESSKEMREFVTEFLDRNNTFDDSWEDSAKSRFIVENFNGFIKGFLIMFGVTDEETYDKALEEKKAELGEDKSPIETEEEIN